MPLGPTSSWPWTVNSHCEQVIRPFDQVQKNRFQRCQWWARFLWVPPCRLEIRKLILLLMPNWGYLNMCWSLRCGQWTSWAELMTILAGCLYWIFDDIWRIVLHSLCLSNLCRTMAKSRRLPPSTHMAIGSKNIEFKLMKIKITWKKLNWDKEKHSKCKQLLA